MAVAHGEAEFELRGGREVDVLCVFDEPGGPVTTSESQEYVMTFSMRTVLTLIAGLFLMAPSPTAAASGPLSAASRSPLGVEATKVPSQQRISIPRSSVVKGALIGAGLALVATGIAAAKYGENESGGFCGACMAQWSLFTVPAGAGIGAGVGYGIDRLRRSVAVSPTFSPGRKGVVITASF